MKIKFISFICLFVIEVALLTVVADQIQEYRTQAMVLTVATVTPAPEKGRILFVSDRTGNNDIYLMDLATKNTDNLTNNPGEDMNPQVSPDGTSLVFYSNRSGNNQIYKMDLNNFSVLQLTDNTSEDYDPSYSPDGTHIVFKSTRTDKKGDIFIMNADGTEQKNLTPERSTTEEWNPKFSFDGKKIIFVVRLNSSHLSDEIFSMNADGSDIMQITHNDVPDWYPSLNPKDGSMIHISQANPQSNENIYKNTLNGTKNIRLTTLPGSNADPSWDPQGKRIIFINEQNNQYDLYLMNADGSGVVKIGTTDSNELSPVFLQ